MNSNDRNLPLVEERDLSLDVIKAILIICVVLGHAMRIGTYSGGMNIIVDFIYHFHMPLFVLLTGYFFKFDMPSVLIKKIVMRYWLPYCSGGMLFVIGLRIFKGVSVVESLRNLVVGRGLGAMWFLYTIAAIETILYVSYVLFRRNREFGLLMAIALFVITIEAPIRVESWSVFYFLCGMLLKGNLIDCRWGIVFGFLAVIIYSIVDLPWYTDLSFVSMCFVISIGLLLHWSAKRLLKFHVGSFLAWLGKGTLVILIFHPLFNLVLSRTAQFFSTIEKTGLSFWLIEAIVGIVGSLFLGRILRFVKLNTLFGLKA
jgi:fucose 4-O-acetylase-like acetyltransferase